MSNRKSQPARPAHQTTLDRFEFAEDVDPEYGHLVDHLIDEDTDVKKSDMWTRVFTRSINPTVPLPLFPIGEDLNFDRSLRATLPDYTCRNGKVLFSPKLFTRNDIYTSLRKNQLSVHELLKQAEVATIVK